MSKKFALQVAVSLACVWYAFSGVDFSLLWRTMRGYSPVYMAGVLAVSLVSYFFLGLRLRYMRREPLPLFSCVKASLLCLGVNNVLPAKAGEIAKAEWLSRHHGLSFAAALGTVFWERFFDVNLLLLLGIWAAFTLGIDAGLWGGALILALAWATLFFAKIYPSFFPKIVAKFKFEKITNFITTLQDEVHSNMRPARLSWLTVSTTLVWASYSVSYILSFKFVAGLDLSVMQALCIFAISSLGMLLPSTPGAIGVFEASTVLALSWFGIDKEHALGIALFNHMLQFIPATLLGGIIFLTDRR